MLTPSRGGARPRPPGWLVVRHEVLCAGPEPAFRRLAGRLGLRFTDETARYLAASNRPGDGYSTHRLWHEQIDGGRSRLTPAERAMVVATLDRFTGAWPLTEAPSVTAGAHPRAPPSHPPPAPRGGGARRAVPSPGGVVRPRGGRA